MFLRTHLIVIARRKYLKNPLLTLLLSAKLLEQWYKFIIEDEFLAFFELKKSKGSGLLVDFREMQSIAETEYAELKQQYDLLVTPDHDGSNFAK